MKDSRNIYKMKVTLCDDPPIWRRLSVPGNLTFAELHVIIQDAMGWLDQHLYEFEVVNPMTGRLESIGIPEDEATWDNDIVSGWKRKISEIFTAEKNRSAKYIYDYGDNWSHIIAIEGIEPPVRIGKYPRCTEGEGACPPEDCGGISGYKYLLRNLHKTGDEAIDLWRNRIKDRSYHCHDMYFKRMQSKRRSSVDEGPLWMRRLLQGDMPLEEVTQDLGSKLPFDAIKSLYDCVMNRPLRYRNRAIGILSLCKGIDKDIIADYLFIKQTTLSKNYKAYQTKGVACVISDKNKRPLKYQDPKYKEKVFSILHSPPSAFGFYRTTWKQDDLHKAMSDCGMPISKGCIQKIIEESGYKIKKARTVLTSNDPNYKDKVQSISNILSNLDPREKFFSIDEYGPFAVKLQGGRSLVPPGTTKTVPQWQKTKGSLIVTAALELATNQVTHFYSNNKNTTEMIKLLDILVEKYAQEEVIYFSWDAASWHASKALYQRVDEINSNADNQVQKTPIVKLAPLPTCAQFLNIIESVFSGMARAIIHNSDFPSVDECKSAIDRYFFERNDHFQKHPKRAGNKLWGKERVPVEFKESNNCKDPKYR
jgi:hypothetical protein